MLTMRILPSSCRVKKRVCRAYSEVIDGNSRNTACVSCKLCDIAQLLQIPQDTGEVTGATHQHVMDVRHSQACHWIYVAVQRLKTQSPGLI